MRKIFVVRTFCRAPASIVNADPVNGDSRCGANNRREDTDHDAAFRFGFRPHGGRHRLRPQHRARHRSGAGRGRRQCRGERHSDRDAVNAVVAEIRRGGGKAMGVMADVSAHDEVAAACVFLCAETGAFVSGQAIHVNGRHYMF